ncbi:MAG: DivIVA domain-containing protein [Anaerovoracaceae bacterium]|jgi:cell division initiation protein
MLTVDDINNKVFSYSMRGYNKREVDEFLDQIIIDYKALINQNELMQNRVSELTDALNKEKGNDTSKKETFDEARRIMNDISASAEQKAQMIINKARAEAEEIKKNAAESTVDVNEEAKALRVQLDNFKESYRKMLNDELTELDDNTEVLFSELNSSFPEEKPVQTRAGKMAGTENARDTHRMHAAGSNTLVYKADSGKKLSEPDLSEFLDSSKSSREEKSESPLSAYITVDDTDASRDKADETKVLSAEELRNMSRK